MVSPGVSMKDHMALIKRVAELEEKVTVLSIKPSMPKEKEELLNATLNRVQSLEQELVASKKAFDEALARHDKLQPSIEKKMKKKKKFVSHLNSDTASPRFLRSLTKFKNLVARANVQRPCM
ncbi:hypothetical protein K1719_005269 [Acacia pycnantha]|nr:hypothetical protein K1719_005269 [Acacia pycnantha]